VDIQLSLLFSSCVRDDNEKQIGENGVANKINIEIPYYSLKRELSGGKRAKT